MKGKWMFILALVLVLGPILFGLQHPDKEFREFIQFITGVASIITGIFLLVYLAVNPN